MKFEAMDGRRSSGWTAWLALAGFIGLCFLASAGGAVFRPGEWYAALRKPFWTPPGWLFGPVWTALYLAMAVAVWRVWRVRAVPVAGAGEDPARQAGARKDGLTWFFVQLGLNAAWSPLFFGLHWKGLAFLELVLLWVAIGITLRQFFKVDIVAGWLLVPYWGWVTFAGVLNYSIWTLNRGGSGL